ncbi:MAG: tRNA-5-carboxymethylaminomethyl-2-thiouridine(34)synthesis protein MnmE, partial [uncultured Gemmatimonadaceae bacterium]
PDAYAVAGRVVRPWPLPERAARLARVVDAESGELLDRPVVTVYAAGRSFTGEPAVELSTHGGHLVPAAVLAALVRAGAREALPGEFTRRAVLNGKLDLVQAEAVGDLIDARSGAMRRTALAQLDGGLSRRVLALREELIGLEALLAYEVDFPEEDDGPVPRGRVAAACTAVGASLDQLLATAPAGEVVREGATVVIAGPPNAGKSSLFNALLGRSRALVTPVPGTTRDAIEAVVDAGRWPLRLVDTAGLRETADVVERLGIEVSERYLAGAAVVIACGASAAELLATVARVAELTDAPVVAVRTKADLDPGNGGEAAPLRGADARGGPPPDLMMPPGATPAVIAAAPTVPESPGAGPPGEALRVSAERGTGLRELLAAVVARLDARHGALAPDAPLVTRARQARALSEARDELALFAAAWAEGALPATVAAVHVRAAVHALESLVGSVDVDDVLARVFSTFCVGK